jgi:hypothetical protein
MSCVCKDITYCAVVQIFIVVVRYSQANLKNWSWLDDNTILQLVIITHYTPLLYSTNTHTVSSLRVESYVTTDGQSANLSWNKTPIWDLRSDFYYCQTVVVLLMWGALSDERTGLSFDPAYIRDPIYPPYALKVKVMLRPTVQSASLSWNKAPIWGLRPLNFSESESHCDWRSVSLSDLVSSPVRGSWPEISYSWTVTVLSLGGRPLWREGGYLLSQSVSSNKSIVSMYSYIHFTCFTWYNTHIKYIQGLCQSGLSTADYALFLVAFATTAV